MLISCMLTILFQTEKLTLKLKGTAFFYMKKPDLERLQKIKTHCINVQNTIQDLTVDFFKSENGVDARDVCAVSPRPYKFAQTYLVLPTSFIKRRHGTALDGTVLRQWPLCYTRIGYRRTIVRREFCLSYAVNHGVKPCQQSAINKLLVALFLPSTTHVL